jgi:UDPglucose 6-dehydrogenase
MQLNLSKNNEIDKKLAEEQIATGGTNAFMDLAIIGSGVVGSATGIGFASKGHNVLFHDIDENRLSMLKMNGHKITGDVGEAVQNSEVLFVCVPTPTVDGRVDVSYLCDSAKSIGEGLKKAKNFPVVVFRSTAPPQTTRLQLVPILEKYSGLKAGVDFGVCMNPEFLREKTPLEDFLNPERIVIGELEEDSGDVLEEVYSSFKCPVIRTSLDTAEMIKYASNLFLASKISFFNEIHMICGELGIDSKIVSESVSLDRRIGKYGVYGGKPFSGMCFPKDLAAFISFSKSKGINPKLLEAVAEINKQIVDYSKKKGLE